MKVLFSILFLMIVFTAHSQQPPIKENNEKEKRKEEKKKIKALYVAYITQELKLDESDAQKFWPVQEQYSSEIKAVNKKPQITEIEREEAILNIRKKYNEKYSKLIGKERTDLFFKKDKEFRNKMVEGLKKKRMEKHGGKKNQE
jgi:hypothetical protein